MNFRSVKLPASFTRSFPADIGGGVLNTCLRREGGEGEHTSPLIAMGAVVMAGLGVGRKLFIQD